jgi:RNA polymerase sigma factor (sigma-70 family)
MKEEEIIEQIKNGHKELYELLMRKYNQKLYRIARAIVKDDSDAEDILQDTYLKAYEKLGQFENRSQFSTWLIRILINNANSTLNKRKRFDKSAAAEDVYLNKPEDSFPQTPEFQMSNNELKKILEQAIDNLPETLRGVYIMREVEGLSVAETSECLNITQENVKTRLHRAKTILKDELYKKSKGDIDVFRFGNDRCDKLVLSVMVQLGKLN